jgi:hypothetical protein
LAPAANAGSRGETTQEASRQAIKVPDAYLDAMPATDEEIDGRGRVVC